MSDYDAIVIGSGAGGLTAAVALANAGQRVLVLEQHYMAGGWCHSFVLEKKYRFSPGVHYIGDLGPGGDLRRIYEGLGLSGDLEFCMLNEDGFDHFLVDGERFDVPNGRDRYLDKLIEVFPHEREGLKTLFTLISNVSRELQAASEYADGWKALLLPLKAPNLVFRGLGRFGPTVDKLISDPLLKAYLGAQSGDHGVRPADAPFALQAAIMAHYFDGGYYPRGGAHRIPRAYVRQLKRKGGVIKLSTPVRKILLEGGRAVGVETADGERYTARRVISNADPEMTFRNLVGLENLGPRVRSKLQRTRWSIACLSLFLATDLDLRSMGYDSGNYWYYEHTNLDRMFSQQGIPDRFETAFLTATTLKDPSKFKGEHTLEVFTFLPWKPFQRWADQPSGERGADYEAFKDQLARRLLSVADKIVPELSENLTFMDVGTPLTNTYYCGGHQGSIYGPEKTRDQLGPGSWPLKSAIPGLWMVGASTMAHGVAGVTISGLAAAAKILRCPLDALLTENGAPLTIYPSERPDEWAGDLRRRRNSRAA